MAVAKAGKDNGTLTSDFLGLSTDVKPTNCGDGSTFYELNTKKVFIFCSTNINPITTNGWWEV
jgi:hypothetical protein